LELSFDFEVAQENPQSEFVTFGSHLFEQVCLLVNENAVSAVRFAEVERLTLANQNKKIRQHLQDEQGNVTIADERNVLGTWSVFTFKVGYYSDEKEEEWQEVWVDLLTGQVSDVMRQEQNRLIYTHEPLYPYPFAMIPDISQGFSTAYSYAQQLAETKRKARLQANDLQKEKERIQNYYAELLSENAKKSQRKGLSEEKRQELLHKTKSIELECEKQLYEIESKYNIQINIKLEHGLLYVLPLLEYRLNIESRNIQRERTLYYNPILKQFSEGKQEEKVAV
jgi:hypothetical protein